MILRRKVNHFCVLLFIVLLWSCQPAYMSRVDVYRRAAPERSELIPPDYTQLYYWAAHPQKQDPSDSIPKPLRNEKRDTIADVFFIHPTTFTNAAQAERVWNASVNDAMINAKTDYSAILYQASVFNQHARVFAPRYRQAHIHAFYTQDQPLAQKAFDTAWTDLRTAFLYYLKNDNQGRPFIIAAHSQGTLHAARLIREIIEQDVNLMQQFVCAYLPGLPVTTSRFEKIVPCADANDVRCFMSWRTFQKGYLPEYISKENTKAVVTNPLTWQTNDVPATPAQHHGAVLFNFNKVLKRPHGAVAHEGVLWIDKPKIPFGFLSARKNFHPGDINLFYMNIRENVAQRLEAFVNTKEK